MAGKRALEEIGLCDGQAEKVKLPGQERDFLGLRANKLVWQASASRWPMKRMMEFV